MHTLNALEGKNFLFPGIFHQLHCKMSDFQLKCPVHLSALINRVLMPLMPWIKCDISIHAYITVSHSQLETLSNNLMTSSAETVACTAKHV